MRPELTYQLDIVLKKRDEKLLQELKDLLDDLGIKSYAEDSVDSLDDLSKEACKEKLEDLLDENYITNKIILCSYSEEQLLNYKKTIEDKFGDKISMESSSYQTSDWAEGWKDSFKPIETDKFLVCPPWDLVENKGKQRIIIEPAMAFGTGQHATTQLCLKLFEKFCSNNSKADILDLGTGSGILAVAAAKKVSGTLDAVDIEEDSVQAAKTNAELNQVSFHAERNELEPFIKQNPGKKYDLIFANILLPVLVEVVPQMPEILKPGGQIILSGLITSQRDDMELVCKDSGFQFVEEVQMDDWLALRFVKS